MPQDGTGEETTPPQGVEHPCPHCGASMVIIETFEPPRLVDIVGTVPKAAMVLTASYLIGLVAIWFGPETRGLPLQD